MRLARRASELTWVGKFLGKVSAATAAGMLALLFLASPAAAFSARTWIKGGAPSPPPPLVTKAADADGSVRKLELGLLPFPADDVMLMGETKQVHLYEARFIQLFAEAANNHASCCGQLLLGPGSEVLGVTSLLEVEEYRKEEYGVWAKLKCVGRVRVLELRKTDYDYISAVVDPFFDDDERADEPEEAIRGALTSVLDDGQEGGKGAMSEAAAKAVAASAEAAGVSQERVVAEAESILLDLEPKLAEAHASVSSMRRKLEGGAAAPGAEGGESGDDVEWGHEVRQRGAERRASLDELIASRRSTLTSQGLDAPPMSTLTEGLAAVWRVRDEAEAERQLLSFAASATLEPADRVRALMMSSTTERLTLALCALRAEQRRLAALVAINDVAQ